MTDTRKDLGTRAEKEAARYLEGKGFTILERNVRSKLGEIDLVARSGKSLVFVEVKAGRSGDPFAPHLHLDTRKRRKLLALGRGYLARLERPRNARFDLISIRESGGRLYVDHFEDVIQDSMP
ncbi:MAG: YraN family protein [Pseudomonadota bacterium]